MRKVGLFMLAAALIAAVGCSGSHNQKSTIDLKSLEAQASTPQDKAEVIALAGERIAYGPGFMHANELFDIALEYDPNNARALTYKALLKPAIDNKGILTRIWPAVHQLDTAAQYDYQRSVNEIPAGDLKNFLLDGSQDIKTEKDVQNQIRLIQDDLRNIRKVFGQLSGKSLTLHANVPQSDLSAEDVARYCSVQKQGPDVYYVYGCDIYTKVDVTLDYADWQASRMIVAAYQAYLAIYNAYDLTGAANVARKFESYKDGRQPTAQQVMTAIRQEAQLGKLIDAPSLKEVLDMGAEGIQAVKWAIANQAGLCPGGEQTDEVTRPGKLFGNGLCVGKEAVQALPMAEAALRGPYGVVLDVFKKVLRTYNYSDGNGGNYSYTWYEKVKTGEYYTMIDATKFFNGSATDLQALMPTQFDRCGNPTNLPDGTLAGTFPNGDAVNALQAGDPEFLHYDCGRQTSAQFRY